LWRETLLLNYFNKEQIAKVKLFGQLPGQIIYRQITEQSGNDLQFHIDRRLTEWRLSSTGANISGAETFSNYQTTTQKN
jgi:hypothetical protein